MEICFLGIQGAFGMEKNTALPQTKLRLVVALTWLAYAYLYVLRKSLGTVKGVLVHSHGYSEHRLASMDAVFLAAYSAGLHISGCLVDVIPPRKVLTIGLIASAIACASLPALVPAPPKRHPAHLPFADGDDDVGAGASSWSLAYLCWSVHGFAQSSGHPAVQKILSRRLNGNSRVGFYLGVWTTSQAFGGILGNACGGLLLSACGWAAVFRVPGLIVTLVLATLLFHWQSLDVPLTSAMHISHHQSHSTVIISSWPRRLIYTLADLRRVWRSFLGSARTSTTIPSSAIAATVREVGATLWGYGVHKEPMVLMAGFSAFFVKFVRYALLFWLPYYNWKVQGLSSAEAVYQASVFELGGFIGAFCLGPISDLVPLSSAVRRRAVPCAVLMGIGAFLLAFTPKAVMLAQQSQVTFGICIFLVGISVDGAESVVTGALCNDLSESLGIQTAAGRVVGFVNGTGILGALVAGPVITAWANAMGGWESVFHVLSFASLVSCMLLILLQRHVSNDRGTCIPRSIA